MKINNDILSVISDCSINGSILKINSGQLDRKMYLSVNKVLEVMGGKWNRKLKGHLFDGDIEEKLDQILLTGEIESPKKFGYFPTPNNIVETMLENAELRLSDRILEPSAGQGAILDHIKNYNNIDVIELMESNVDILIDKGWTNVNRMDFMEFTGDGKLYDKIIMNPPFEKQQDIDHVLHAYSLLSDGGRVISIMSAGMSYRQNKKSVNFRNLVEEHGYFEHLPENSFKKSGTGINTVMIVLNK